MSLLEQDITRKRQVDQAEQALLESEREFEVENNQEYEVKAIIDSTMYG